MGTKRRQRDARRGNNRGVKATLDETDEQSGMEAPPLKLGAIFGIVSYAVGYLTTLGLVVLTEDSSEYLLETAGWVYYNAQFADVTIYTGFGGEGINLLTGGPGQPVQAIMELPSIVYHLVPILVLVSAGFILAWQVDAVGPADGAVAGASIAVGTVIVASQASRMFKVDIGLGLVQPGLVDSILIVGLIYPAVFGGIGGLLSTKLPVHSTSAASSAGSSRESGNE